MRTKEDIMKTVRTEIATNLRKRKAKNALHEVVESLYDAVTLKELLQTKKSPKLPVADRLIRITENKVVRALNEFDDVAMDTFPSDGVSTETNIDTVDNSDVYDSLVNIMECAKQLYMNIDIDAPVNTWLVEKIEAAEINIRTASEYMGAAIRHDQDSLAPSEPRMGVNRAVVSVETDGSDEYNED